ncbi:MAG: hypothetical protein N0C90_22950 [Candidatus Thiodiazotropha endolucinida]|nr:hypothetical protein [Candidatus Thiodiazotropha taylori]MCW4264213.1 hypothetical protein [Candidatus Thiodiazotropha endolucinida]
MYDFWYNYIKEKYKQAAQLQMIDTDSLFFACETSDIFVDMKESIDYFDTSDYPREHFLHSDSNKKVLGKMKDETNGKPISEFVGLRSKMYSFICDDNTEEKRAKGISKVTVRKELRHDHYRAVLMNETNMTSSMTSLRSYKHELFAETIQKTGLSAFDDKRYLMDAARSYAYGHYKIPRNTISDSGTNNEESDKQTWSLIPVEQNSTAYKPVNEQMFTIGDIKLTPCIKL